MERIYRSGSLQVEKQHKTTYSARKTEHVKHKSDGLQNGADVAKLEVRDTEVGEASNAQESRDVRYPQEIIPRAKKGLACDFVWRVPCPVVG